MPIASDAALDGLLDVIATCTRVSICQTEPANFAGIAAVTRGSYTLTGADFTKANGDTSGRKLTLSAKSGNNATATGQANFLAFDNGTVMHYTTPGDGDTVNSGSPFTISSYKIVEVADPT